MILTTEQSDKWLYYETGFDQLHPAPPIITWMEEQGYTYKKDWDCTRKISPTVQARYVLKFPNEEIKTMFMLRWS